MLLHCPPGGQEDPITWELAKFWPLCASCRFLLGHPFVHGRLKMRDVSSKAQAKRLARGICILCRAIYETCTKFERDRTVSSLQYWVSGPGTLTVQQRIKGGGAPKPTQFISIRRDFVTGDKTKGQDGTGEGRRSCVTLGELLDLELEKEGCFTQESISFMKQQLENCLGSPSHSICSQGPGFNVSWPARVIKIAEDCIYLVDFDSAITARFAALSYRWGSPKELRDNPPLQLNASTQSDLCSGVPVSDLPLTLKQAVQICGHIGLEYLWIDALCIIQDSSADWANEAKKMATVYRMATVTIIAASAWSCHEGFLRNYREGHSGFHKLPIYDWDPTDERGWTLQEDLLSTWILRFTRDDIQWKCSQCTACICRQPTSRGGYHNDPEQRHGMDGTKRSPLEDWFDICATFSVRQLTVDADKLAALSSLARVKEPLTGSAYVAGVYAQKPVAGARRDGLVWRSCQLGQGFYNNYIAPSFSWASVNARVAFDVRGNSIPLSELVNISATPTSDLDPFGRVSGGFLTLRGPLEWGRGPIHDVCQLDFSVRPVLGEDEEAFSLQRSPLGEFPFEKTGAHVLFLYRGEGWMNSLLLGRHSSGTGYQRLGLVQFMVLVDEVKQEAVHEWLEMQGRQEVTIY
ncbi:heterokaryon incompatibility protein-domain-containing protein [Podospora didyma]|uniref:Heterokaryon incompatibility protein-domain-containing protein n=1 Tax=Podospora didyma TaxID=330526 RepID=A0AAE0KK38_9PEZI|nr:heterokaryon incompatibility protein-domain-containing protein [Podospora didyma]